MIFLYIVITVRLWFLLPLISISLADGQTTLLVLFLFLTHNSF